MYEDFIKVNDDKRASILNAAFAEFATRGYEHASTNRIVEAAGISKGILFHYFGSKKGLFEYLYDYAIDTMLPVLRNDVNYSEPDLFLRLRQVMRVKLRLAEQYPSMSDFLQKAHIEAPKTVEKKLKQQNTAMVVEAMHNLYAHYDKSKFKEGIAVDMAFEIIFWTIAGFSDKILAKAKATNSPIDYTQAFKEADRYLEILQNAFYKDQTCSSL